jgi:UPF0716 protein FxsA
MNTLFLLIIGIPIIEIFVMIKMGQQIGAINTILLIFLTATIGIYFVRIQGLNTIKSGFTNLYQNKTPIYEIISGASIAVAAILLILPGFITDFIGFALLFPFTRKVLINNWISKNKIKKQSNSNIIDAEIIEDKKKDDNKI